MTIVGLERTDNIELYRMLGKTSTPPAFTDSARELKTHIFKCRPVLTHHHGNFQKVTLRGTRPYSLGDDTY